MENEILDDAAIEALLNEDPTDGEGNALPTVTPAAAPPAAVPAAASVPTKLEIPPELLAQGGILAQQVQSFLSGNAATQKAILDKLSGPAPAHETAEERQGRAQKLFNDFVLDPEKVLNDYAGKGATKSTGLSDVEREAIQGPAFQAMGEMRIKEFLAEQRDNDEVGLDPKVVREIEKEFHSFAAKYPNYEREIGSKSKAEASEILNNLYLRSFAVKIRQDTIADRKTQGTSSVAGKGGAGSGAFAGISKDKLDLAKATAAGLATGDDGKVDKESYAEYLKLALGR